MDFSYITIHLQNDINYPFIISELYNLTFENKDIKNVWHSIWAPKYVKFTPKYPTKKTLKELNIKIYDIILSDSESELESLSESESEFEFEFESESELSDF